MACYDRIVRGYVILRNLKKLGGTGEYIRQGLPGMAHQTPDRFLAHLRRDLPGAKAARKAIPWTHRDFVGSETARMSNSRGLIASMIRRHRRDPVKQSAADARGAARVKRIESLTKASPVAGAAATVIERAGDHLMPSMPEAIRAAVTVAEERARKKSFSDLRPGMIAFAGHTF